MFQELVELLFLCRDRLLLDSSELVGLCDDCGCVNHNQAPGPKAQQILTTLNLRRILVYWRYCDRNRDSVGQCAEEGMSQVRIDKGCLLSGWPQGRSPQSK